MRADKYLKHWDFKKVKAYKFLCENTLSFISEEFTNFFVVFQLLLW